MRPLFSLAAVLLSALPLLAADPPVVRSAKSGPWSAAATWDGGNVPATGSRVLIRAGHRVEYDVKSEAVIRGVNVAGTLAFAPDGTSLLDFFAFDPAFKGGVYVG